MAGIPIERLPLSVRARNVLHRISIHYVDDLLVASLEDISKQKNIGAKTLQEIEQVISMVSNGEIEFVEDDIEELKRSFSDEQLFEMSRHNIIELNLSRRPYHMLCRVGYETIDKVACLSEEDCQQFRGVGEKSINEIIQSVNYWLKANGYISSESRKKGSDVSEEMREVYEKLTDALSPILQVNDYQLNIWISQSGVAQSISLSEDIIDLEHNIRVIMKLPELQTKLRAFWFQEAPQGIIEIEKAEEILQLLQLSFNPKIIIECSCENYLICKNRNYYLITRENFNDYFLKNSDMEARNSQIIRMRVAGTSLQETGDAFGITRERVRQISAKIISKYPLLFEDYFAQPFEHFHISKSAFKRLFPEISAEGYEYISIRYQRGRKELNEITLAEYEGYWKNRLLEFLDEEHERIDKITVSRTEMVYRVLMSNADTPLSMDEFEEEYYSYLRRKNFPLDRLKINLRTVGNHMRNAKGIVFNRENKARYCDADPQLVWDSVDFSSYKNMVISAELIYRDYSDLMEELDIRDGYELFYVIKASLWRWNGDFEIVCRRVPVMVLGNASEEEQALRLLKEISPVEFLDYFSAYEERFGLRKETAPGNPTITNAIIPYYIDGRYVYDAPAIANEDIVPFKDALKDKNIWFIDEIEELFDRICVHSSRDAINTAAFRRIGYILHVGYAFDASYGNATTFLDKEIFSKDIVDLNYLDRRLIALPAFTSAIEKKKNTLEYIETAQKVLLSRNKVQEVYGLTVDDIRLLQESLSEQYQKLYFNADSIWEEVKDWPLIRKLQGNKWMLTCIMRQQENVFTQHFAGNMILSLDSTSLSFSKICAWLASIYGKMTVRSLEKVFNETFGCHATSYKIAWKLKSSGVWEDIVTDSMEDYIDSLVDLSEIDDSDLFQEEFF